MSFIRISPLLCQRLFTTSARARNAISMEDAAAAQLTATANAVPKLGRIARWYLPTMAAIALGFGITNALDDANRKVHMALEPTQEQKNMMLMDSYGERSSLEDMERAIAGLEARLTSQTDRNKALEEAYGDRGSIKDLQRAMQIYEVQ
ncbi:hypothetical protein BKA66DRAFT_173667 [Pyrenochaeta sp. MPI-SDFR-AT-0127]|nr:hypothetical protein BKA66DRAFT_173667 [Pyrenochaeta sp. MPI-SDFR-AT-0127]